jgi:hypothetical protein
MAEVKLVPLAALDGAAWAALAPLADAQPGGIAHLAAEIDAGWRTLWAGSINGHAAGWMVTRTETAPDGLEFWISYAIGGDASRPVSPACLAAVESYAAGLGCRRVIFWTRRTGLARIAELAGYSVDLVLQKELR